MQAAAKAQGADWRDPRFQTRFMIEQAKHKTGRGAGTAWDALKNTKTAGEAASVFVHRYLRPAARHEAARIRQYQSPGGIRSLEGYTGPITSNESPAQSGGGHPTSGGTPPAAPTGLMEGDYKPRKGSGGVFNEPKGTPIHGERETIRLDNGQTVTVNKKAAAQFKGFFNDLIAAGAPVRGLEAFGTRPTNASQHPAGMAIDWAQSGWGKQPADIHNWIVSHPKILNALEQKWGIGGGEHWGGSKGPDTGHMSIDAIFGPKHLAALKAGANVAGTGGDLESRAGEIFKRKVEEDRGLGEHELPPDRSAVRAAEKTMTHRVEGSGEINVNVKAPPATKVTASSKGLFRKTNIERTQQMEPASGGPEAIQE
jgi:hypothetical protein